MADLAPAPRAVAERRHLVALVVVLDGPIVAVAAAGLAAAALLAREAWRWRRPRRGHRRRWAVRVQLLA